MRFKHHQSGLGRFLEDRTALFYNGWGSAILLLGALMDVSMTGLWLPRAGAVVAGSAAYTYFFDPRTSDDWWARRRRGSMMDLVLANATENAPATGGKEVAKARRMAEHTAIAQKLNALAEKRDISKKEALRVTAHQHHLALQVQGWWVLIGTLVWAFGDIPVELIRCGAVPCSYL
ncbi:MAG: hypothetical protein ABIV25_01085 [Paracoccaceae bacterium]